MSATIRLLILTLLVTLPCVACKKQDPNRKQTFPVTGEVYVDGQPAKVLEVTCHDVKGMDMKKPTISMGYTKDDGKFSISTYEQGDGMPEGEYVLTFVWGKLQPLGNTYTGPDKLNGRYKDPKGSKVRVKVEKGKPAEVGRIDLTTK